MSHRRHDSTRASRSRRMPPKYFFIGILILCGLALIIEEKASMGSRKADDQAYQVARDAVKSKLEKPETAIFDDAKKWTSHTNEKYTFQLAVQSATASGETQESFYFVRVDDDLHLLKVLQIDHITDSDLEPLHDAAAPKTGGSALDPLMGK